MKGGSSPLRATAGSLFFILTCACVLAAGTHCVAADGDATHVPLMFRADPCHSGINDDGGITPIDALVWMNTSGDRVYSSPAVVDGVVYIGSDDHTVYAFDAETGTEVWTFETGGRVLTSPAVAQGVVYIGSYDTYLYALDKDTGSLLWDFPMGGWVTADPVVTDGIVYSGSLDGTLYAVDATSGTELWNATLGEYPSIDSSPAVADGLLYVTGGQTTLYALDSSDGSEVWNFTTGNVISSSPSVADGIVYVSSWDKNVYALDALTGQEIWTFETGGDGEMASSPAVAYGAVYIGSCDNNMYALDAMTGEKIWNYTTGNVVYSSPTYANGIVYAGSWDGKMYAIDALTGEEIWTFETGDPIFSSPAVANGIVYFGSLDWNIYAVGQPPDAPPVADFAADVTFGLVPLTVSFTDSSTGGGPRSYQWDFGDGTPNASGRNPVHTYMDEGTYTVTLTVNNSAGSSTLAKEGYIAVFPDIIVGGDKGYYLIHSNVGGAEVYFNGDWFAGTIENGTLCVEVSTTGTPLWSYTVQKCGYFPLTQENTQHPAKDETVHLYANLTAPKEPLIADFSANVTSGAAPLSVGFTCQNIGIAHTWNWSFGDGMYSEEEDPVHTYTSDGTYTVSLHLTNSACQEDTMEKVGFITVGQEPPFSAGFTVMPAHGTAPLTVQVTDASTGNPTTFLYEFGDGFRSMAENPVHTYRFPGTYAITQTVSKYDPVTKTFIRDVTTCPGAVTVFAPLNPVLSAEFSAFPVTGPVPLTVAFTDESIGNPTQYLYDFGDGYRSMAQNPVHTYRTPGIYNVNLKVFRVGTGSLRTDFEFKEGLIIVGAG